MSRSLPYIVVSLLVLSIFGSCHEDLVLDRSDRRRIDTLFRAQTDRMIELSDSICQVKRDSLYPVWLDSVIRQRTNEREKILKKRR